MFSAGMLAALAVEIAVRSRGFPSASPPPMRAAIVISLIKLVKSLPLLASAAPFLCLILCHLECPDISILLPNRCTKSNRGDICTQAQHRFLEIPKFCL